LKYFESLCGFVDVFHVISYKLLASTAYKHNNMYNTACLCILAKLLTSPINHVYNLCYLEIFSKCCQI
jgi:hypothetical protein